MVSDGGFAMAGIASSGDCFVAVVAAPDRLPPSLANLSARILVATTPLGDGMGQITIEGRDGPHSGKIDDCAGQLPETIRALHLGSDIAAYDILRGAAKTLRRAGFDIIHIAGGDPVSLRATSALLRRADYRPVTFSQGQAVPTESDAGDATGFTVIHARLLPDLSGSDAPGTVAHLARFGITAEALRDVEDIGEACTLLTENPALEGVRIAYDAPTSPKIDDALAPFGMVRLQTGPRDKTGNGSAAFIKRPAISCRSIGSLGRFGNHLFQYLFLQCYGRDHGMTALNLPWAGDDMFNVAPGIATLPEFPRHFREESNEFAGSGVIHDTVLRPQTDFEGFFQYETRYYRPHQTLIREHLSFKGAYKERAQQVQALFDAQPGPVAALHLRRGDYGYRIFFIAPEAWYLSWLESMNGVRPTLYIASDDLDLVLPAFDGWRVISERDLPPADLPHGYFTDFAALTLADQVAISNSSFSFAASMLNTRATTFMRPNLRERALIPYDPWDAPVLLRDMMAEDGPEGTFRIVEKPKPKSLRKRVRNFFRGTR